MATIDTTDFMTTAQAAKALDLSVDTIKKYCQQGDLSGVKVGSIWLVPKSEIKRYKEERKDVGRPSKGA